MCSLKPDFCLNSFADYPYRESNVSDAHIVRNLVYLRYKVFNTCSLLTNSMVVVDIIFLSVAMLYFQNIDKNRTRGLHNSTNCTIRHSI